MLKSQYTDDLVEAGCDEAGRGCLAGPVFAAAVVLPKNYRNDMLDDSKKLTPGQRSELREIIMRDALAWAVASVEPEVIDVINILNASILAMHTALDHLSVSPGLLLIDGNRFKPYRDTPHQCIIKGDGLYLSIAAASVLAKTSRDSHMEMLHADHPAYDWLNNKGYPAKKHRDAIAALGVTEHHRKSFRLAEQLRLSL